MRGLSILSAAALVQSAFAVDPTVSLGYADYRGVNNGNGITQWLGMRYAAPPIGDLRFAAPQHPNREDALVDANAHGPICLATGNNPPDAGHSEDCLFLDIYAPTNATKHSNLPVYFFIQGGGFNTNSNPNYNGTGLVKASGDNIIVVNFNYRVGPYGFLASKEVHDRASVNNGLKDQRFAMQWVQKHIRQFGGDPRQVTMGGDSAGAQSVTLHVTAYGGRDDGLFARSAAESQSFSGLRTIGESQYAYDNLSIRAGCASSQDTLSCLRSISATDLQKVNFNTPFPGAQDPPLYMYGPVLDFDFITDYTYRAYAQGRFIKKPAIYGDDTNEGTIFVPSGTNSIADSDVFMKDNFPRFTQDQLRHFNDLYPNEGQPQFAGKGSYWRELAMGYGELRYICPGIFVSQVYAQLRIPNSYNYRWNVIDPSSAASGYGVSHTIEVNAIWGPSNTGGGPASYKPGGVNADIVPVIQGYWTSFIRCGNPNTHRLPGSPTWEEWSLRNQYQRLKFETNSTVMEAVPSDQKDRCRYLSSIGVALTQ